VNPVVVGGVLGLAVVMVLGLLVLARRRRDGWWGDPAVAAGVLGAARGPFAVILAFVILVGFQRFNNAQSSAEREAAAVRTMFNTAAFLDTPQRESLQVDIFCYARAVIALDWPAMSRGRSSQRVDVLERAFDDDLKSVQVGTMLQNDAVQDLFNESTAREQERADRIAEADNRVPEPVWIVLGVGALGLLAYVLLFANSKERFLSQAIMVGAVTTIIVGGLILVWFLSHPYRGETGSIRPSAMERVLDEIQHNPKYAGAELPLRCDAEGNPR
jgi:Protein of unknown function (DUF4239)